MGNNLVIVESPAKVKTIKKFLGNNYVVMASQGHVRDLPRSQMGVDVENGYEPKYITIRGKGELLAALRKEVKKADKIYLATDPDREGEAISWHLTYALKLEGKAVYRITFNEITKKAVQQSLKNARQIDMNLVDAQQARRVLDRVVGYRISPILWAKIKRGLSAGRVQSVALRIICDRENDINAFVPTEYWTIDADLLSDKSKKVLNAKLSGKNGKKIEVSSQQEADEIKKICEKAEFKVSEVKTGERSVKAPLPFTTSTLQQEASKQLNFATSKTMRIAQQLYEGVELAGEGDVGIITYLRTDSVRVSDEAVANAKSFIEKKYGAEYAAASQDAGKGNGNVQDAHEAIRPTDILRSPDSIKASLSRDQFRLYQLIYKRFVASRMTPCVYETQNIKINAAEYDFSISASKLVFDGFKSVYSDSDEKQEGALNVKLEQGDVLKTKEIDAKQHFTQPPAHFTEASLVHALEELGIGRPSTYAPTISTIIARHYIAKEGRNLFVTELGEAVNAMMLEAFPEIVDVTFTANMEALLDKIGEGEINWKTIIENFYPDLDAAALKAEKEVEKIKIEDELSDVECDVCGRRMAIKYGPYGKFLACPGFPECRNIKPFLEKTGKSCPNCGKELVVKRTKKGRKFFGCEGFPECDYMTWQLPK